MRYAACLSPACSCLQNTQLQSSRLIYMKKFNAVFALENTDNCNYQGHEPSTAISAAIAEISAHRRQQENVIRESLNLNKKAPTASQFTFTCESGVPGTVQWPGMYPITSTAFLILANLLGQVNQLEAAPCQQTHRPCQPLPIHRQ